MSSQSTEGKLEDYPSKLLAANKNWAQRLNQTFPPYFPDPRVKQAPKIIWLGCSDSRVQESDALVALPGLAFVHRNIANQVHPDDENTLSVLAYALGPLEVQHIAVVGHSHCGGVISALQNIPSPGLSDGTKYHYTLQDSLHHIVEFLHGRHDCVYDEQSKKPGDVITRWLTPLVEHLSEIVLPADEEDKLKAAIAASVRFQVDNFTKAPLNEFVRTAAKGRQVWVHGWVYNIENGFIHDLNVTKVIQ